MSIGLVGETEVALVFDLIFGLRQLAQHHRLDHITIRPTGNGTGQAAERRRCRLAHLWRPVELQPKWTDELLQ